MSGTIRPSNLLSRSAVADDPRMSNGSPHTPAPDLPPTRNADGDGAADAVLARMAAVRAAVAADGRVVADSAGELADWKQYVRAAPLACTGAAALVGYLVVPSRSRVVKPDEAQMKRLAEQARLQVKGKGTVKSRKPGGLTMGLLTALGNVALRAGTAYVSQQAGKAVGKEAARQEQAGDAPGGPGGTGGPR